MLGVVGWRLGCSCAAVKHHLVLAVFLSISCSPEQGLHNNQEVIVTYFQLITYHVAQGKQSSEGNSTETGVTNRVQSKQRLA